MRFNEEASNPMLVGALNLYMAEDTDEHRKLLTEELVKATFLAPALVEPAPTKDAEGRTIVANGSRIQLPMLTTMEGKRYFILYTDKKCLDEATTVEGKATPEKYRDNFVAVTLSEIGGMLTNLPPENGEENPLMGVIINPFNEKFVVNKEMPIGLFKTKMEAMRAKAEKERAEAIESGKVIPFPGTRTT
jgi:hypothetical protein